MASFLGFGQVGRNLAMSFEKSFKIFDEKIIIDTEQEADDLLFEIKTIQIPAQERSTGVTAHEKYDAHDYSSLEGELADLLKSDEIYLAVSGGSDVSGAVLSIVEFLSDKKIHVIYIKPENQMLQNHIILQERATRGILQEYARSNVFERIILFDNDQISDIIGNVPVKQYYKSINDTISYLVYTLLFCESQTPVFDASTIEEEFYRINVLGIMNQNGGEILCYDYDPVRPKAPTGGYDEVQFPVAKNYHYLISGNKLEEDPEIMKKVRGQVNNKEKFLTDLGYLLYDSDLDDDYILVKLTSGFPQV